MNQLLRPLVAVVLTTVSASAWGPEGHEIVGRVAEKNLTPAALQGVNELLNGTNTVTIHLADDQVVNWADSIRKERNASAPWHYVDIPFAATQYDPVRDCQSHTGCVVEAIVQFQQVLANSQTNREARVEALKFLVHFVGDIHMPLHCAERHGDQGGNKCWVRFPGNPKASKLHGVWDVDLVQLSLAGHGQGTLAYADRLAGYLTPERATAWQAGTSADWAWESHQIAVTKVYAGIPLYGPAFSLTDDYVKSSRVIVDEQLMKAGIRLAWLLNQVWPATH